MIRTIVLTNPGGETLALDLFEPWKTGIAVKNVDGLGPGKADINTTDLALTDSALFNGSRVCLVYTYDAADALPCINTRGHARRQQKKKETNKTQNVTYTQS